jgi:hypothetical protein
VFFNSLSEHPSIDRNGPSAVLDLKTRRARAAKQAFVAVKRRLLEPTSPACGRIVRELRPFLRRGYDRA